MGYWTNRKEKINDARGTQGGLYFVPGNYIAQIQRCKMIETRDKDEAFVCEFKVIETDVEDKNLKPGSQPSYFVNMDGKFPDLSLGNVADIMRAGLASLAEQHGEEHEPQDEIEITDEIADAITEEQNLLAGVFLQVYAFNKPTRENKPFTRIKWSVPENLKELVAANA
jgi:hypothetical protein